VRVVPGFDQVGGDGEPMSVGQSVRRSTLQGALEDDRAAIAVEAVPAGVSGVGTGTRFISRHLSSCSIGRNRTPTGSLRMIWATRGSR
jgi:hypothetical protein